MPMDVAFDLAARRIEAETGLHFPSTQRRQLNAALQRMAAARGYARQAGCPAWLLAGNWNAEKTALCARFLTVGEPYFSANRAQEVVDAIAQAADPGGSNLALALRQGDRIAKLRLLLDSGVLSADDTLIWEGLDSFQHRCLRKLSNAES